MRRILSIAVLAVVLFLITVLCTGVSFLANMDYPAEQLDFEAFAKGDVHLMFLAEHFWQGYPNLLPSFVFIYFPSLAFAGLIVVALYYLLGYRKKWPAVYVGLVCLVTGFIPYFTGMWALHDNIVPSRCGKWVAVMLLGMLYCFIACAIFAILDIFKIDIAKLNPRISLRRPYLSWDSAGNR